MQLSTALSWLTLGSGVFQQTVEGSHKPRKNTILCIVLSNIVATTDAILLQTRSIHTLPGLSDLYALFKQLKACDRVSYANSFVQALDGIYLWQNAPWSYRNGLLGLRVVASERQVATKRWYKQQQQFLCWITWKKRGLLDSWYCNSDQSQYFWIWAQTSMSPSNVASKSRKLPSSRNWRNSFITLSILAPLEPTLRMHMLAGLGTTVAPYKIP